MEHYAEKDHASCCKHRASLKPWLPFERWFCPKVKRCYSEEFSIVIESKVFPQWCDTGVIVFRRTEMERLCDQRNSSRGYHLEFWFRWMAKMLL